MIRHFFLDKTNSIIKKSEQNIGLNPILNVSYGADIMRGLIHFDLCEIKSLISDKTFANRDKLTFTLKMTNCSSVDGYPYNKQLIRGINNTAYRATSFDLMLFKLPRHFDAGKGFDFVSDMWVHDNSSFSKEASNWYCSTTGLMWNGELKPKSFKDVEGGIYPQTQLIEEYEKYLNGDESIVVGSQHFDFGDENLSIDITKYVWDVIDNKYDENFGLCLSFTPQYEEMEDEFIRYVGFFTDNTNTFFHPYVEVLYDEYIRDDRESFTNGKDNRLYLYVSDDGIPTNLDKIPVCLIDDKTLPVKQATKGVYYAEIKALDVELMDESINYDIWSEIALNGVISDDVELEFVANKKSRKLMIGDNSNIKKNLVPSFYGINDDESIAQGEVREVCVDFREKYNTDKKILIDSAEYRIYVKDGNREFDVIPYQPVEKSFLNNFFMVYTTDLIPNQYFVDVKINIGRETKYYRGALRFKVVSNVTERYQ